MPTWKSAKQYEQEARSIGECLVHPAKKVARRIYERRIGYKLQTSERVFARCGTDGCISKNHLFVGNFHTIIKSQCKTVKQYEAEAAWINGCLIHPASVARKIYQRRHKVTLPSNIFVCHRCDVGNCILDKHHFLGTHTDNMQDASKKGRLHGNGNASELALQHWANKTQRANHIASYRFVVSTKDWQKHHTAAMRRPEVRTKLSVAAKLQWSNENRRAARAEMTRLQFLDPIKRANHINAQRLRWKNTTKVARAEHGRKTKIGMARTAS